MTAMCYLEKSNAKILAVNASLQVSSEVLIVVENDSCDKAI